MASSNFNVQHANQSRRQPSIPFRPDINMMDQVSRFETQRRALQAARRAEESTCMGPLSVSDPNIRRVFLETTTARYQLRKLHWILVESAQYHQRKGSAVLEKEIVRRNMCRSPTLPSKLTEPQQYKPGMRRETLHLLEEDIMGMITDPQLNLDYDQILRMIHRLPLWYTNEQVLAAGEGNTDCELEHTFSTARFC